MGNITRALKDDRAITTASNVMVDGTLAISGSNLNITDGVFTYTDGKNNYGYNRKVNNFTGSVDFTGATDGLKWVGKNLDASTFVFKDVKPTFDTTTGLWSGEATPLSFLPNPIQVTSATPQYIDYSDELATNVMDSLSVGKLDVTDGFDLKPNVTYMSKSGHNSQAILVDGKLYQANGTTDSYNAFTTGVYNSWANTKYGVMNGWNNITYPSNSPIKKVGGFILGYSFILTEAGELFTFGYNGYGQCGLGHTTNTIEPTLSATGVIDVYTHPSQGEYVLTGNRLFILKSDGLYGCGWNEKGQVGIGNTTTSITTFTKCTGLTNTSSSDILKVFPIGNAYGSTWVLTSDNKLWVTGTNNTGWHGDGTTTDKSTFTDVTSHWVTAGKTLADVKITGGSRYYDTSDKGSQGTIVILLTYTDGTSEVKTAGYNGWGSLGNGTTTASSVPVSPIGVPTDGSIIDIAGFGSSPLTVQALSSSGDLWSWGYNGEGECGDGTSGGSKLTPAVVTTGVTKLFSDGMTSHAYGYRTQALVKKSDGLYMAGFNNEAYYAGMGVTVTGNVTSFSKVKLPEDDNDVADIGHFTTDSYGRIFLALTSKGNIYTWGYNVQNGIHTDNGNHVPVPQLINIPRSN